MSGLVGWDIFVVGGDCQSLHFVRFEFTQSCQYSPHFIHGRMISQIPWYYQLASYNELLLQSIHANNLLIQSLRQLQPQSPCSTASPFLPTTPQVKAQPSTQPTAPQAPKPPHRPRKITRKGPKRIPKRSNDTKNIPKNFGKAIMTFILKNPSTLERLFQLHPHLSFEKYMSEMEDLKNKVGNIADLRELWNSDGEFGMISRTLSQLFLRKYCLNHIYNSRITNYSNHVKYRYRMMEALRNPSRFQSIKEY